MRALLIASCLLSVLLAPAVWAQPKGPDKNAKAEAAKNFNKQFYPAVIPKEICASTLQNWYIRSNNGSSWQLDAKFIPLLDPGTTIARGGGPIIFKDYPGVQADICSMIQKQKKGF